jgi:RNA polymerase sigma-70 factor (ECF subfamily)
MMAPLVALDLTQWQQHRLHFRQDRNGATAAAGHLSHGERMLAPADPDRADVRRVLAGDADAFSGIVERWQRPLVNLAYRFCRHRGQAEDMAQEAFLRAFTRLHQWREDAKFSTWLYAVALNVFRSATRREALQELPLGTGDRAFVSSDPLEDLETRQMEARVRRMVRTLPRRYREAVILFYFLDRNVAEAANVLGLPEGTFKARLHRGRALLKRRLSRLRPRHDGETT